MLAPTAVRLPIRRKSLRDKSLSMSEISSCIFLLGSITPCHCFTAIRSSVHHHSYRMNTPSMRVRQSWACAQSVEAVCEDFTHNFRDFSEIKKMRSFAARSAVDRKSTRLNSSHLG